MESPLNREMPLTDQANTGKFAASSIQKATPSAKNVSFAESPVEARICQNPKTLANPTGWVSTSG
jgi:hypothetical protein